MTPNVIATPLISGGKVSVTRASFTKGERVMTDFFHPHRRLGASRTRGSRVTNSLFCEPNEIRVIRDCTAQTDFYVRPFYAECNRTARSAFILLIRSNFGLAGWKATGRERLAAPNWKRDGGSIGTGR